MLNHAQEAEDFEMTLKQLIICTSVACVFVWCAGAALGMAFKWSGL